jgi:phosphoribosyl 1,2-cyclic phosphodiesterase
VRVTVLGSGSRGNAVALRAGDVTLLIDAGFGLKSLRRRAAACGVELESVAGILVTHEHGDHSRGAAALAKVARCPVYGSHGTLRALRRKCRELETVTLPIGEPMQVADFTVSACHTRHDAIEPIAVTIASRRDSLKLGLAYDVGCPTNELVELLRDCHCLMIEANHDEAMLHRSPYPVHVRHRIAGPGGHLSNRTAARMLSQLAHGGLGTVVLLHLSDRCNDPHLAAREIGDALATSGFCGRLHVACQDEPLEPIDLLELEPQLSLGIFGQEDGSG